MEVLFEIAGVFLQFVGELLLQVVLQILAEFGLYSVREAFNRRSTASPFFAGVGYCILGAGVGGLSLVMFPALLIHHSGLQIANLVVTPLISGILMILVGKRRLRRDQEPIRLDRFGYGLLFALSMAAVRFCYSKP